MAFTGIQLLNLFLLAEAVYAVPRTFYVRLLHTVRTFVKEICANFL